jgi:hypothetical protein
LVRLEITGWLGVTRHQDHVSAQHLLVVRVKASTLTRQLGSIALFGILGHVVLWARAWAWSGAACLSSAAWFVQWAVWWFDSLSVYGMDGVLRAGWSRGPRRRRHGECSVLVGVGAELIDVFGHRCMDHGLAWFVSASPVLLEDIPASLVG